MNNSRYEQSRIELGDAIKDYTSYSSEHGSKNLFVYANIYKLVNKTAGIKSHSRKTTDIKTLDKITCIQFHFASIIRTCLCKNDKYREIYPALKLAAEKYAKGGDEVEKQFQQNKCPATTTHSA
jgi:hypothetical protein